MRAYDDAARKIIGVLHEEGIELLVDQGASTTIIGPHTGSAKTRGILFDVSGRPQTTRLCRGTISTKAGSEVEFTED